MKIKSLFPVPGHRFASRFSCWPNRKPSVVCFIFILCLPLLAGCQKEKSESGWPKDYESRRQAIIAQLDTSMVGTWLIRRIDITAIPNSYYQQKAGITKDTILVNPATLTIEKFEVIEQPRYPVGKGYLTFNGRRIPISFKMLISPERIVNQQGYYASFLFETDPFFYSYQTPEDEFVKFISLVGENYTLEEITTQRMRWNCLNAKSIGINTVEFLKQ